MATRLTDVKKDLSKLNHELERIDHFERILRRLEGRVKEIKREQIQLQEKRDVAGTNNLVFTWTDATATVTWAAGFVRDHDGVRVHQVPADATGRVLTANTSYWAGWNPIHQTMSFEANLDTLALIPNVIVICRIQTGNGLDGTAGGGGTEDAAVGILQKEYAFA